jgi:Helix-turn-helix domain
LKYLSPEKYLSPRSVAIILDVNRSTAYRWMRSGVLPAFELVAGQWRCSEAALTRFLRKKEKGGTIAAEVAPTIQNEITGHSNGAANEPSSESANNEGVAS